MNLDVKQKRQSLSMWPSPGRLQGPGILAVGLPQEVETGPTPFPLVRPSSDNRPEFRQQMVELVRAGGSPEPLAKAFGPSGQTIRNWVIRAELDEEMRRDGPTRPEQEEMRRLRRENQQLRVSSQFPDTELDGIQASKAIWAQPEVGLLILPGNSILATEGLTECKFPLATWKPLMSVEKIVFICQGFQGR